MEKVWILTGLVFALSTFFFWRMSKDYFQEKYGERMRKLWGAKLFYWQGILLASYTVTLLVVFLMNKTDLLT